MEQSVGDERRAAGVPHVVVFPFPAQGHINTMLRLSELLLLSGIHVTFLDTDHVHRLLVRVRNESYDRLSGDPHFRFLSVPDGLPDGNSRSAADIGHLYRSIGPASSPRLVELFTGKLDAGWPPVTCIITDGIMFFVLDIGREVGLPVVAFRTVSACSFWVYFNIPHLIEAGDIPFPEDADLDTPITNVRGMETVLRRRDLPSFCRARDLNHPGLQLVLAETPRTPQASALILNSFEHLEGPSLSLIRPHHPTTYAVGPLHALLKKFREPSPSPDFCSSTARMSLWEEDRTCLTWLDAQPPRSVIYISFGSFTVMTSAQLLEFWHGLMGSGHRFLWVVRPDSVDGLGDLMQGNLERGRFAQWAPQEEVLVHGAVGAFLTHSGWNSTLESVAAGLPMVCWPFFADQQVNSRFVSEVWGVGLDMKDKWDRAVVERMVRDVMEGEKAEELRSRAAALAEEAERAVETDGSSHRDFLRLVDDIRSQALSPPPPPSLPPAAAPPPAYGRHQVGGVQPTAS